MAGRGCGRKNVVKMFYFTCNHLLSSTCVQHAKTLWTLQFADDVVLMGGSSD